MKVFKRNAVIITVLIFVCVAVYLNWSYAQTEVAAETGKNTVQEKNTEETKETETEKNTKGAEASGLFYVEGENTDNGIETIENTEATEYFDQVRLTRQQARDSAEAALQTVTETTGAAQNTIDEAMTTMVNIAKWTEAEAQLESLIIAKGFQDCVAYMTDDGITITVATEAEALSDSAVARIKDIVLDETEYTADQLKIIEIK